MKKKQNDLLGSLDSLPENQIYLNINHLDDGNYALKIMQRGKVIKEIFFKKEASS